MTMQENSSYPTCPDCGSPQREVRRDIPNTTIRRYECGVAWLDVDDDRTQVAFSGAPWPCAYIAKLHDRLPTLEEHDEEIRSTAKMARQEERARIVEGVSCYVSELPTAYDDWRCLDAEEKGAVLEDYFEIVRALRDDSCDCLPPDAPDPDCTNPNHGEAQHVG